MVVVREQFLTLSKKYHPDVTKGDSEEANKKFIQIKEAFDRLGEMDKDRDGELFLKEKPQPLPKKE